MAKARIEILGDSQSYQKAVREAERATKRLNAGFSSAETSFTRATRGAIAGSGAFRSLGRSIAFASGGFVAFAGLTGLVRTSLDAAREAGVTQAQLGAQFKASGLNVRDYQKRIDAANLSLSALAGVNKDELDKSFTTILRGTNNVTRALKDEKIAVDIAAGRHIALSTASIAVAKAAAGSTTSLKRLGIQLPKGTTGMEALTIAARRFRGQAAAGATAQSRFGAVLHDSEVIIGSALLPTLNKYLGEGARWLNQMNESGRLQRDVQRATHDVGEAFKAARTLMQPLVGAFRLLETVSGGTKHALELLGVTFVSLEIKAKLIKWGLISSGIRRVGASAAVAEAEVAGLAGALSSIATLGTLAGAGLLAFAYSKGFTTPNPKKIGVTDSGANVVTAGGVKYVQAPGGGRLTRLPPGMKFHSSTSPAHLGSSGDMRGAFAPGTTAAPSTTAAARRSRGLSLQGQFNLAELRLANAQLTVTQSDDRRILVSEAAIVRLQLTHVKTLKDRTALTQKLAGIVGQIQSIDQADAQASKDAAKAARDRAQTLLQTREFKVLGLDATGQPFTPGLRALRKELASVSGGIKGTSLDTSKNKGLLGNINKLLFGKDAHQLTKDVRATIKQLLDGINDELKSASGDRRTKFRVLDAGKLLGGLGLSPDQLRAARGRIAQIGRDGRVPRAGGAFGVAPAGAVIVNGGVHLHGVQDVKGLADALDKHGKQRSGTRRGRNAGHR
jgi:hypothetical protein